MPAPKMMTPAPMGMPKDEMCHAHNCTCSMHGGWAKHFLIKLVLLIGCVVAIYGIVYLDTLTTYQAKKTHYVGRADSQERFLTVTGYGKVVGTNDIAMTTIGYSNVDKDVAAAQLANKRVMDAVALDLKKLGISNNDLKSNYSIYPEYSYSSDKGQELKGYRVTNSMSVKIRNLANISSVLNLAGKYGANQVGGLDFTIDDAEVLKAQARTKALENARTKALSIARTLGLNLTAVTNYNEYESADYPALYDNMAKNAMVGASTAPAPEAISSGSKDVSLNVSITYLIGQ